MESLTLITARLALYIVLCLLFGMPLFGLYALRGDERTKLFRIRPLIAILAISGMSISLLGFGLMAACMSGTDVWAIDRNILAMLLSDTAVGWAFGIREIVLLAILVAVWLLRKSTTVFLSVIAAFAAAAVGTLAWSGHGAGTDGAIGFVHLVGDIVHLLAASAWLGALAMLACLIVPTRGIGYARITTTHRALAGFATIGSIIVGLIMITGIMNSLFLIGIDQIGHLATDTWGRLMLAKITLFVAMLGMAAANRFRLTPRLEQSIADGNTVEALSTLRRSVLLEIVMAFGILGLVAWLGTLEPIATG